MSARIVSPERLRSAREMAQRNSDTTIGQELLAMIGHIEWLEDRHERVAYDRDVLRERRDAAASTSQG